MRKLGQSPKQNWERTSAAGPMITNHGFRGNGVDDECTFVEHDEDDRPCGYPEEYHGLPKESRIGAAWQEQGGHRWTSEVGEGGEFGLSVDEPTSGQFHWQINQDDQQLESGIARSLEEAQSQAEESYAEWRDY
jgi:hypothetical protein